MKSSSAGPEQREDLLERDRKRSFDGVDESTPPLSVDAALSRCGYGNFQYTLFTVVGLCWMADAMELMILSIIAPALRSVPSFWP